MPLTRLTVTTTEQLQELVGAHVHMLEFIDLPTGTSDQLSDRNVAFPPSPR